MLPRPVLLLLVLLLSAALVAGCSDDDDDDPTGPGGGGDDDTTAPLVTSVRPATNETGVAADQPVTITFSEDMDTASDTGQITLSPGAVTSQTWTDARTLVVAHDGWPEGATVTVTVGTGLTDAAGNALAAEHVVTFYVESGDLLLLASDPADGATDVGRSVVISLLFSAEMDPASFTDELFVTDEAQNRLLFQVTARDDGWVLIDPTDPLPADQQITVTVSTSVQDVSGRNLTAPVNLGFTTGSEVDDTPPTIERFEPTNGSELDPDTSFLQVVFSEPMNPDAVDPARINAEFLMLVESGGADPTWNADFTELTVPLPAPLPAGLPLEVTFADYADAAGNVQTTPTTWTAAVAGTPDYYPLADGRRMEYAESGAEGTIGNIDPEAEYETEQFVQFDAQGGGVFHRTRYADGTYAQPRDWDVMQQVSGALEYLGFGEVDGGETFAVDFDSPLTFTTLPPAGTWDDQTTATVTGEGTFTLTGAGEMVSESDLPWLTGEMEVFWKDVRLVVIDHSIAAGSDLIETGVDSLWLSPTVGIVQYATYAEDLQENRWDRERGLLMPPGD
jgi:hypothetical protein